MKIFLIIVIAAVGVVMFFITTIVFYGRKRERKLLVLQDEMKYYESLSKEQQQFLYDELVLSTVAFCESINEVEKAVKIGSGKFSYRDLKFFEISYMRKG